jgi:actinorhodin biosynthesis protein ActVIA
MVFSTNATALLAGVAVVTSFAVGSAAAAETASGETPYTGTSDDFMQINQLFANYNFTIDNGDGVAWAANFTEDGVFQDPTWCARGRRALIGVVGDKPQPGKDERQFHAHSLGPIHYLDRDHARAHSTVVVVRETGAGLTGGIGITGTYDDQLDRVNGKWLFSYRLVHRPSATPAVPCPAQK